MCVCVCLSLCVCPCLTLLLFFSTRHLLSSFSLSISPLLLFFLLPYVLSRFAFIFFRFTLALVQCTVHVSWFFASSSLSFSSFLNYHTASSTATASDFDECKCDLLTSNLLTPILVTSRLALLSRTLATARGEEGKSNGCISCALCSSDFVLFSAFACFLLFRVHDSTFLPKVSWLILLVHVFIPFSSSYSFLFNREAICLMQSQKRTSTTKWMRLVWCTTWHLP